MITQASGTIVVKRVDGNNDFQEVSLEAVKIPITTTGTAYSGAGISGDNIQEFADSVVAVWPPVSRFKNKLIGGDFGLNPWQRGTDSGFITGRFYQADRWKAGRDSSGETTRAAKSTSAHGGNLNSSHGLRLHRQDGDTAVSNFFLLQDLTSANSYQLAGKDVTFSCWIKGGVGGWTTSDDVEINIDSGTGIDESMESGYTGRVRTTVNLGPVTTDFVRYSVTASIPQNATQVGVFIYGNVDSTPASSQYLDIANCQLEIGSVASDFEHRDADTELALCTRYYREQGPGIRGRASTTSRIELSTSWETPMRAVPTAALLTDSPQISKAGGLLSGVTSSLISANIAANGTGYLIVDGYGGGLTTGESVGMLSNAFSFTAEL